MRHYYLTCSGSLKRKDNMLCFEPAEQKEGLTEENSNRLIDDNHIDDYIPVGEGSGEDFLGRLFDETTIEDIEDVYRETEKNEENEKPLRVRNKRILPVEDIDSIWVFRELDLNAKVLNFLARKKIPVHFFNYYGFYAGSFYPREYLQAGFLLVRQVKFYNLMRRRLPTAREFVAAGLHNILRNLRYYGTRGTNLREETEIVQTEVLDLESVKDIKELMGCEGRARAGYYRAFEMILKPDLEFGKRVRRPPNNMVNAMISCGIGKRIPRCR